METSPRSLAYVYEGVKGYNDALTAAIQPLTAEQLAFKGHPDMNSVGELALHIADGRVDWYERINPEPCQPLRSEIEARLEDKTWNAEDLCDWLNKTYAMVHQTLQIWTVDDLTATYEQPYAGKVYAVSRQWVIWRIMAHDIHHGGQLSELLAIQDILPAELTLLGGHLTEPPLAK